MGLLANDHNQRNHAMTNISLCLWISPPIKSLARGNLISMRNPSGSGGPILITHNEKKSTEGRRPNEKEKNLFQTFRTDNRSVRLFSQSCRNVIRCLKLDQKRESVLVPCQCQYLYSYFVQSFVKWVWNALGSWLMYDVLIQFLVQCHVMIVVVVNSGTFKFFARVSLLVVGSFGDLLVAGRSLELGSSLSVPVNKTIDYA